MSNDPGRGPDMKEFSVSMRGDGMIQQDIERAKTILDKPYPVGGTPITSHIRKIENKKILDFIHATTFFVVLT